MIIGPTRLIREMGTQILELREAKNKLWSYTENFVAGALRLVSVQQLLSPDGCTISLLEWRDFDWAQHEQPSYAAISHVWQASEEVARISDSVNRPLVIDIGQGASHTISWHGLIQAAIAAQHLQCEYIWLDLVCLHQCSHLDKAKQIKNMGNIYKNATAVLVMPSRSTRRVPCFMDRSSLDIAGSYFVPENLRLVAFVGAVGGAS